jgi:flagellar assembly protein FliH
MKKFLFDTNNFDKQKQDKPVEPVYSAAQLQQAAQEAHALGRAEAAAEAKQAQEEVIAAALKHIGVAAEALAKNEDRREIEKDAAAVTLAMKVAHKLMPQFAQKYALPEIERAILDSLDARRDEPRIAVMVPTQHLEALAARIDALALEKGFAGKMILIADDHLKPSDCRVEWADGGAERLYDRLYLQIETEFAKAIAGMNIQLAEEDTTDKTH